MKNRLISTSVVVLLLLANALPVSAEIIVGTLSKEQAEEMGITMRSRKNGDAGVKVWLEFKKEGFLEAFTYAEMRMEDADGKHLVSAMLKPHPVVHGQAGDLVSVAFSAQRSQLEKCFFLVVFYGSKRGDVGYDLRVRDFIEVAKEPS